jgi:cytochrome c oxidase subunit 2
VHKFWSILFGAVLGVCGVVSLLSPLLGWKLPENVASYGPRVDNLFHLILAITGLTFVLVEAMLVWAMWRFVARPGAKSSYRHGHHKLEMVWTAVPAAILLFIAFAQVSAWADIKYQSRMPDPDLVFEVSARQFEWRFRYPASDTLDLMTKNWKATGKNAATGWEKQHNVDDVHVVNEVHVWKHTEKEPCRVRMYLKTKDVLHSFFLPNLRIKQDALPGKTIPVFYDATEANVKWNSSTNQFESVGKEKDWELACAELCGWGHYKMRGRLYVYETKEDYLRWLKMAAAKQNATKPEQDQ